MPPRTVYLDHNATTPLHPEVKKTITEAMEYYGNASSLHGFGRKTRELIEQARANVASFINAEPEEVIFVGSGSEANNTVLNVVACDRRDCQSCHSCGRARSEVITTSVEHPCVLNTAACLKERGNVVHFLAVDSDGLIKNDQLLANLCEKTALVSVMMANNETGTLQDIAASSLAAHQVGALFHTDAVQAVGKVPVDVKKLGVDFLSFSAHKIYGPKGIGALYVKKGTPFCPFIRGGHQEFGRRAGTENTLGIFAFSRALDMRRAEMDSEAIRLKTMRETLRQGLISTIPDIRFNGHPEDTLPGTLNVSFMGAEGEAILLYLDLEGIAVSTGSACASGSLDPSHVLLAMGLSLEWAHGSIRISLGRETTDSDIHFVLEKFQPVIEKIRRMSTTYKRRP
ncbi:MAG: aminotransferase class V-fold PLP-dependent enzyme [Candidatus Wallbacteria bacterium]|nr:aminotransferase class V-fold PLP-dependent enzyme [Candidatus Wallbacteria bacterium]